MFYFSYREFHEFRTKTINDNDIISIDEKIQFEQLSKVTEKVRNCVISIYALLRKFKKHLTSIAVCFDKVLIKFCFNFFPKLTFIIKKIINDH